MSKEKQTSLKGMAATMILERTNYLQTLSKIKISTRKWILKVSGTDSFRDIDNPKAISYFKSLSFE